MDPAYKAMTNYLVGLGTDEVPHSTQKFLGHLVAVYHDLEEWGCEEAVCRAGMFHSIYGTQKFQRFSLPLERRDEVQKLIGQRAERLAYWNSAMDRASFDAAFAAGETPFRFRDRFIGETLELTAPELDDLCRVQLSDWLEQVPRSKEWDYRRPTYERMAARLGGAAQAAFERVYAAETAAT